MGVLGRLKDKVVEGLGRLANSGYNKLSKLVGGGITFPHEMHFVDFINGKFVKHNWTGPHTNVDARVELMKKGLSLPVNDLDKASMRHDIAYSKAKTPEDIWKADDIYTKETKNLKDSKLKGYIAGELMQGKKLAEKLGLHDVKAWIHK